MKRLLLVSWFILALSAIALASPWQWFIPDKSVTVSWDAVDTYTDANGEIQSITTGVITYRLYITSEIMEDPANPGEYLAGHGSGALVGETDELTYVIPIPSEGKYALGIQTVRTIDGAEKVSNIGWSTDPTVATGGTFGVDNYFNPNVATNFRKS